jgi:hypothetical protein
MIAQHQIEAATNSNITNFTTGSAAKNNPRIVRSCACEVAVITVFSIAVSVAIFTQNPSFIKNRSSFIKV